jgi:hypothetical protein
MRNLSHAEAPGKNISPLPASPGALIEPFIELLIRSLVVALRNTPPLFGDGWISLDRRGRDYLSEEAGVSAIDLPVVVSEAYRRGLLLRRLSPSGLPMIGLKERVGPACSREAVNAR